MKIVSMGGGTGLSTLLKGLKTFYREDWRADPLDMFLEKTSGAKGRTVSEISAVVGVSDDGGSSGRLRREFRVLPPGDIRNCMVALSEDEALLSRLFQYRFSEGRGLKGHSFGNLFLTALSGVTGDFQEAIKVSGEVLAIRGRIFPSTTSDARLEAVLKNGRVVKGETRISRSSSRIERVRLRPDNCEPLPQTLDAIRRADVITLGPGSLFTSLIPNLLVRGVAKEMAQSSAARIFICNLMTQPGETTSFSAGEHIQTIYKHCGEPLFDYVLVNTAPISSETRRRYQARRARPVMVDREKLGELGVQVVEGNFVSEERPTGKLAMRVRHDPIRLAQAVLDTAAKHPYWANSATAKRKSGNGAALPGEGPAEEASNHC
jgi:uncharacterized cofD-like protein